MGPMKQAGMERLDKAIASQTTYSRSDVHKLMSKGQVLVNGTVARAFDSRANLETDTVTLDGRVLNLSKYTYIMMNKPRGVVCATEDEALPTVIDLVPEGLRRSGLFPAGRLDKETEGFVLVTNDGEFAHRILSPKSHVPKIYLAALDNPFDAAVSDAFAEGVALKPERPRERQREPEQEASPCIRCLPATLEAVNGDCCLARVVVRQGMYHQVRRMFAAFGLTVLSLKRERIGGLELDSSLLPGECRVLTPQEVRAVREGEF